MGLTVYNRNKYDRGALFHIAEMHHLLTYIYHKNPHLLKHPSRHEGRRFVYNFLFPIGRFRFRSGYPKIKTYGVHLYYYKFRGVDDTSYIQ